MSSHTSIFSRILSAIMLSPLEIGIALLGFAGWMAFYRFFWLWYRAPFKNLPGPKSNSWLFGSFKEIMVAGPGEVHAVWMQQYGHTIAYKGILGAPRIWTADPLALKTVLTRAYDFPKDDQTRDSLADVLGKGLLFAEGADHARQKRIMNPAFAPAQIRDNYTPIFWQKAYELRDCLSELVPDATNATRIDVYQWLGKATLDVIGLAGFGYDFDSLHDPDNELARAYGDMFKISFEITPWVVALALTPGGKYVPNARQRMVKICMETSQRIGRQLVEDKKRAVGDDKVAGRDLLSLIVRANMDPDLKETQRMTDEEMFGQITTFMLAGQETSSTALNWTLWKLSSHKDVQDQLRKECAGVQEEQPGMDAINELPFLDAVVRESLRLMAPVPVTRRDAAVDTELPLSIPVKGRDGKMMDKVPVPKGTAVLIPILTSNKDKTVWGQDADEFKPSRWLGDKPAASVNIPGVWGNMMTFIGGPRSCIGYRFAVIEIKVILFVLIRSFVFEECDPKPVIEGKTQLVTRPIIKTEPEKGAQMPLMMRAVV